MKNQGCPVAKKCGGCMYSAVPYEEQLKKKQEAMEKLLGEFGPVQKIIGMKEPCYYRNKVHHVFSKEKGEVVSGSYQADSHIVVKVDDCLLEDKKSQEIIKEICRLSKSFKLKVYDEDTGFGFLRHVLIRTGFHSGEIMVVIVTASQIFPGQNNFVKALKKAFPEITTIILNINDKDTSMVLGERNKTLYGPGFILDTLSGISFRISPSSFYQVNPVQTEKLYQVAVEYARLKGTETVIDAYCGIGTIGLVASKKAGKVIGVELNAEAVADAAKNTRANHIENAKFVQGDASDFLNRMAENKEHADVIFMDPPRSGSTEKFMKAAAKMGPSRIVYVSCEPETLKRDLQFFQKLKYEVRRIQPVDMFPFTPNVETVVLLSKGVVDKDNFRKVKVDFSLEDMDLTELRGKATYAQVKEYILNEFGLKVSSLYIAQVKKKCGIETGENHNLPKSEDAKQPHVTPEKEEAIMKAFRHFGVI